jgi:hypothetical protein
MTRTYGKSNRSGSTQLEPLLTVARLKETYLFGMSNIVDSNGKPLSDDALQAFLDVAKNMIETSLDLALTPRQEEEVRDYIANNYYDWGYFNLFHYPIISIEEMFASFVRDNDGDYDTNNKIDIPTSWQRLKKDTGILRLVPNNKFPAALQVNQTGNFFPELFLRHGRIPDLWVIRYTWGFKEGEIPPMINHAIGLIAAMLALTPLGNLVLGPGIAGSSLSLDGLSQSVSTTMGSGKAGGAFAAQMEDYRNQLWGKTPNDPTAVMTILRNYYKGSNLSFI